MRAERLLRCCQLAWVPAIQALDWTDSQFHLQYGRIDVPSFAGGGLIRDIRLYLDLEGSAFANLDITAYIGDSEGVASGGAPQEGNSFMVDLSFARPFKPGEYNFSVEGHIEYIGGRKNRFGDDVQSWLLAQPQLRWNVTGHLSLGIECQYWMNKLGDGATDANIVLALFVWQFQHWRF